MVVSLIGTQYLEDGRLGWCLLNDRSNAEHKFHFLCDFADNFKIKFKYEGLRRSQWNPIKVVPR